MATSSCSEMPDYVRVVLYERKRKLRFCQFLKIGAFVGHLLGCGRGLSKMSRWWIAYANLGLEVYSNTIPHAWGSGPEKQGGESIG